MQRGPFTPHQPTHYFKDIPYAQSHSSCGRGNFAPSLAFACPTVTPGAASYTLGEDDLNDPRNIAVYASGNIAPTSCGYAGGYATSTPQMSITFTDISGPVQVSTLGTCDTVLLVNAPDGSWWFDDDSGNNLQAWMVVDVTPGRMDIWVGTYAGSGCDGVVQIS